MENFNLSFPIDMIKKEERIVSGIATADNIDKSGDIVEFNASLEAFKNWGGNIREMHAPIAVGKAISYEPVEITGEDGEKYKAIKVSAYISKGAQNTWEKILDGTLKAFSIGGKIIEKAESTEKMFRGRPANVIKKYTLGELSLVDNPANALAIVDIVKMDTEGNLDYILDIVEDLDFDLEKAKQPLKDPKGGLTAAGRRHFKQTEGANLKPGVKGPADTPEKMRRKGSFLTRFFTNPSGPMKKPNGEPTRLALSAAAWGEPVPQNMQDAAALAAKGRRLLERYENTKKKSVDIEMEKEGEVTSSGMGSGIKNPEQGNRFITPTMPKKKKKDKTLKKSVQAKPATIKALQKVLSDTVVLSFSAQRAHWNVQGIDFSEFHDLFGEIYEETYAAVDPLAENIRKVGGFPLTLSEMEDTASFEDATDTTNARRLAADLYEKNGEYIEVLKMAFDVASKENEQGVADYLAGLIDAHQKLNWQLNATLSSDETISVETEEEEEETEEISEEDSMTMMLDQLLASINKMEEESNLIKTQDNSLQNDVNYDKVLDMNEQEINRLSLLKRVVNWLVPDVQENASTENTVEVTEYTQEEDMDIEVLKDALSAVVDDKLANFATSIKEEVEASLNEKIDNITKGFEANTVALQEKLEAAEKALAETEEQVSKFAEAGAIKKSVDPEDDEEGEELEKSESLWGNLYLPQGLIKALGYKS
jgi:DNA-binding ferritin-like protein